MIILVEFCNWAGRDGSDPFDKKSRAFAELSWSIDEDMGDLEIQLARKGKLSDFHVRIPESELRKIYKALKARYEE